MPPLTENSSDDNEGFRRVKGGTNVRTGIRTWTKARTSTVGSDSNIDAHAVAPQSTRVITAALLKTLLANKLTNQPDSARRLKNPVTPSVTKPSHQLSHMGVAKAGLIQQLQEQGITTFAGCALEELTVGELRVLVQEMKEPEEPTFSMKKDFCAGVTSLNREYLEELLDLFGEPPMADKTKDHLMLRIREHVNRCLKSDVPFGKYKGRDILTALSDAGYQEWCDNETQKGVGCNRDLLRMVAMARLGRNFYQKKQEKARLERALKKEEEKKEKKPMNPGLQKMKEEPKPEKNSEIGEFGETSDPEENYFYEKRAERIKMDRLQKEGTASSSDKKPVPPDETVKKEIKQEARVQFPMTRAKPEWTGRDEDWDAYTAQCREWLAEQKQPLMSNSEKRK